jgi:hypothetical protein
VEEREFRESAGIMPVIDLFVFFVAVEGESWMWL